MMYDIYPYIFTVFIYDLNDQITNTTLHSNIKILFCFIPSGHKATNAA